MDGSQLNPEMSIPDPWSLPLDKIDPSRAELYVTGAHHDYFRRLRQEDPVHYCAESQFGPYWSVTTFNDIMAVDSNHAAFSSSPTIVIGDLPPGEDPPMFIAMDPPVHDVQRKAVTPAVAPGRLIELERVIRGHATDILDGLPVNETFDWVERVSKELTTRMLATLFGFPFEQRHLLPYWSDVITTSETVGVAADMERREAVLYECLDYFTKIWRERAAAPQQFDFISLFAHNPATKTMVDNPQELMGNLMLLIVGGNDTTRNSISGGVVALNAFPHEYEKLKADHSLIQTMVPEIIRWQTPLAHMRRNATRDVELGGKTIRKGDKVVMWYVSGNRDETVIETPDAFIVDRDRPRHHLSFGFGIHRCMGNRVAEMQLKILWEEIMKRFAHIEQVGEPKRVVSNFVLGYEQLPVRIAV